MPNLIRPVQIEPKNKWFRHVGIPLQKWNNPGLPAPQFGKDFTMVPARLLLIPGYIHENEVGSSIVRGFSTDTNFSGGEMFLMNNNTVIQWLALHGEDNTMREQSTHTFVYSEGRAAIMRHDVINVMTMTAALCNNRFSITEAMGKDKTVATYILSVNEEGELALQLTWLKADTGGGNSLPKIDKFKPNCRLYLNKLRTRLDRLSAIGNVYSGNESVQIGNLFDYVFGDKLPELVELDWIPYQVTHSFLKFVRFMDEFESDQDLIVSLNQEARGQTRMFMLETILEECRIAVQRWHYTAKFGNGDNDENSSTVHSSRFTSMMANARALRKVSARGNSALWQADSKQYFNECTTIKISPGRQSGKTTWALDFVRNSKSTEAIVLLFPPNSNQLEMGIAGPLRMTANTDTFFDEESGLFEQFTNHRGPITVIIDDPTYIAPESLAAVQEVLYQKMKKWTGADIDRFELILLG
jgi:hypothetical protein